MVLGYNFFIVVAGNGLPARHHAGQGICGAEWYADLFLTVVWVTYFAVFLLTFLKRTEPHIYVANWFYLAFILTIAVPPSRQ